MKPPPNASMKKRNEILATIGRLAGVSWCSPTGAVSRAGRRESASVDQQQRSFVANAAQIDARDASRVRCAILCAAEATLVRTQVDDLRKRACQIAAGRKPGFNEGFVIECDRG